MKEQICLIRAPCIARIAASGGSLAVICGELQMGAYHLRRIFFWSNVQNGGLSSAPVKQTQRLETTSGYSQPGKRVDSSPQYQIEDEQVVLACPVFHVRELSLVGLQVHMTQSCKLFRVTFPCQLLQVRHFRVISSVCLTR